MCLGVTADTRAALQLVKFLDFTQPRSLFVPATLLDARLVACCDRLHSGRTTGRVWGDALAGDAILPGHSLLGRFSLQRVSRAFTGWRRLILVKSRKPLTCEVVALLALRLLRAKGMAMGLSWLLIVDPYLRRGRISPALQSISAPALRAPALRVNATSHHHD